MIQTEKSQDTLVVRPSGPITRVNAAQLQQRLKELIDAGATDLTIDLAAVDVIDLKGLSVFVKCHRSLRDRKGTLTVITDNEDLLNLFTMMQLDHFTVRRTAA